jgi:esterase/lipase
LLNESNARDELQDILNDREYTVYQPEEQGFFQSLWEKIRDAVIDWLNNLFPEYQVTQGSGTVITLVLVILGLAALGIVLFLVSRNVINKRKFANQKPLQHLAEKDWSYRDHLEESQHREEAEDYSLAVRHLFLALLLYFHEKEWLQARKWKTNWEYYEELQKVNTEWAEQFYSLALKFDEAAYGERRIVREEFIPYKETAMKWLNENHQEMEA